MRLLYISSPSFADCDFPLIKSFQNLGVGVTYLICLTPYELRSTLIDIKKQYQQTGIFPATIYPELREYNDYMDLKDVLVLNRSGRSRKSVSYWKDAFDLYKFIIKGNFDIIHSDLLFSNEKKYIYKFGNVVTTIHDPFPHSGETWNYNTSSYNNAIKYSKGIVLLNETQKDRFCRLWGGVSDRLLINRLGIYENIRSLAKSGEERLKNNILFFGRIAPYKGIEFLCEAMKRVIEVIPDATLTIAGSGNFYFDIEPYRKLGFLKIYNQYIGMKELAGFLYETSLTVCPYTDATQSGVIMTSFALGRPVIASNVGGLGEMIEHGRTGLLVPPKDSKALADAIITLLTDQLELGAMERNIETDYNVGNKSWDVIAKKYIEFYNTIIKA